MNKFLVFRNLKVANAIIVDRVYPLTSIKFIDYNKFEKWFNVHHTDGSWQQLKCDDDMNEKMFNQFIDNMNHNEKTEFK